MKCSCQMVSIHHVPPRLAPQGSTMATEGVSVRAGSALGLPNMQGRHNDGYSHCYNLGKDIATKLQQLRGIHIPWQIDQFLSVVSENGTKNENKFLATPPQASLYMWIPHWVYPLLLAGTACASPAQQHSVPFLIRHRPISAPQRVQTPLWDPSGFISCLSFSHSPHHLPYSFFQSSAGQRLQRTFLPSCWEMETKDKDDPVTEILLLEFPTGPLEK